MTEGAFNKSFLFYFLLSPTDIGISVGIMKEGMVSNGRIELPKLSSLESPMAEGSECRHLEDP